MFASTYLVAVSYPAHDIMLWLAGVIAVAAWAALLLSEMADTESAVHPAGRNQR